MVVVADVYGAVLELPSYVSLGAVLAFFLLLALYLSQRRDLERLREWMEVEPGHPATDLSASEALLDRAELELEAALGAGPQDALPVPASAPPPTPEPTLVAPPTPARATPTPPLPGRDRVTAERPALERITMERAALLPHPRWRRLVRRVSQPRVLGLIAACAVVLGLVAIFGSERLLHGGGQSAPAPKAGAVVPADVSVAVLNGTSVPGLAAKVGDDIRVNGFKLGAVSNSQKQYDQTVVMYQRGQKRGARSVAHDLGVKPVQPIDRQTQMAASGADVVVVAGADRARP